MSPVVRRLLVVCSVLSGACDAPNELSTPLDTSSETQVYQLPLVQADRWELASPQQDPWAIDQGRVRCGPEAVEVEQTSEGDWVSINTQQCGWATLRQPLQESVEAGEELLVHLWYFKFVAPKDPSTRYDLVLAVDGPDNVIWRREGIVPAESGVFYDVVQAPSALTKGQVVYWHVANHGSNRWELIRFAAQ